MFIIFLLVQKPCSETNKNLICPAKYGKIKWVIKLDYYVKANQLSDKDFKEIIGVEKATFDAMVKILKEAYEQNTEADEKRSLR